MLYEVITIAAITGCADLITKLQTSQDAFTAARLSFQQEQAQEGELANATSLKKQLVSLLNDKLVAFLNGMVVADSATYSEYATTVNQIISRITSYNVCYTKLLRLFIHTTQCHCVIKLSLIKKRTVITSYSIHYTKLYDAKRRPSRVFAMTPTIQRA